MIPAAGLGTRLRTDLPKALVDLAGRPLLVRTLERLESLGLAEGAIVLVAPGHRSSFESVLREAFPGHGLLLFEGGAERQDSVAIGLGCLDPATEIVVIHDAARPFVAPGSVTASIEAAAACGAATVAIPSVDTILESEEDAPMDTPYLAQTPDRCRLWACQTPQTFRVAVIRQAHEAARRDGHIGTDDASLVRRMGGTVRLVLGTPLNFKVTTPADLALAACVIREGLV